MVGYCDSLNSSDESTMAGIRPFLSVLRITPHPDVVSYLKQRRMGRWGAGHTAYS